MTMASLTAVACSEEQEGLQMQIEQQNRVRQWLDTIPDIRLKADVPTSKRWASRKSASFSSMSVIVLEEWEDESLFDALETQNRNSGVFCCFRGIFRVAQSQR